MQIINNMKSSKIYKKVQRGLTLVEAAMVLAVATMVVAGVMIFFQSASMNNKTNEAMAQLADIQQVVRSISSNQPDYASVSTAGLIASNGLPVKMISGATVRHAFNGNVTVAPASFGTGATNNAFTVTYANVPSDACSKMGGFDLGRGHVVLRVGTTTLTLPTSITALSAACGTGNVTMIWTFL